jgi:hypothetical protein
VGPLERVTYRGLTQSVIRLDRMNSSTCDYPEKIPVDSNVSLVASFSSGSSSLKGVDFCQTLCLVYVIA